MADIGSWPETTRPKAMASCMPRATKSALRTFTSPDATASTTTRSLTRVTKGSMELNGAALRCARWAACCACRRTRLLGQFSHRPVFTSLGFCGTRSQKRQNKNQSQNKHPAFGITTAALRTFVFRNQKPAQDKPERAQNKKLQSRSSLLGVLNLKWSCLEPLGFINRLKPIVKRFN